QGAASRAQQGRSVKCEIDGTSKKDVVSEWRSGRVHDDVPDAVSGRGEHAEACSCGWFEHVHERWIGNVSPVGPAARERLEGRLVAVNERHDDAVDPVRTPPTIEGISPEHERPSRRVLGNVIGTGA